MSESSAKIENRLNELDTELDAANKLLTHGNARLAAALKLGVKDQTEMSFAKSNIETAQTKLNTIIEEKKKLLFQTKKNKEQNELKLFQQIFE